VGVIETWDAVLVSGSGRGRVLWLEEPLSFWGGVDPATGDIVDARHPAHGESVTGRVLVLPHGRGSSSAASALAEAIRRGTGPHAIVLSEPDAMLVLGALVPGELYGTWCPVVVASDAVRALLADAAMVEVDDGGFRTVPG
jgi:predicted aconitase with swiveling domain